MAKNRLSPHLSIPGEKGFYFDLFYFNKKRRKEALVLTLLACIGVLGFFYVFNCMHTSHSANLNINYKTIAKASPAQFVSNPANPDFEIEGDFLKTSTLEFKVAQFDQSVRYFINFGDGTQVEMLNALTEYAYPISGNYTVSLAAIRDNGTSYISKRIEIK